MTRGKDQKKLLNIVILIANVILVCGLVMLFLLYDNDYKQKIYQQNVDDISNINQSSANIASSFFEGRETKVRDLVLYIEQNDLTLMQSLDYINEANSDEDKSFELLGQDYTGFSAQKDEAGHYIPVSYTSDYKTLRKAVDDHNEQSDREVGFLAEFTDNRTALKSFALYGYLELLGEDGQTEHYMLMSVYETEALINYINLDSDYQKLSTVLINEAGDYILGNSEFKSNNFFKYLYAFNDLTRDQEKEVEKTVKEQEKGSLEYLNARGQKCVFVFTMVPNKNWYCVTSVPVEYFQNREFDLSFTLFAVLILLVLLGIDFCYLALLNKSLKVSIEKEKAASMTKMDFLSRMSHDMRTPMNGIIGMTRLTQDVPGLPEEVQTNLSAISDSSAYLLNLINDTLDMNKIESKRFTLNPEVVNSKELIQHVLSTVEPLVNQKQIKLEYVPIHVDLVYIKVDRIRAQQVLLNVLSNAVKFTPTGGTIRLEMECLKREKGIAYDRISVIDSGCGMSEEFLKHIYEPFSQEHTKATNGQEGTGLGMSIVKNLVELMGGRIEITSTLGKGTNVTAYLNFERVEELPEEIAKDDELRTLDLTGKRILLAEDHPLNATIAIRLLEKRGITVEHAENGISAVSMFRDSEAGQFDLILMDIRMPEMDGLQATRAIRSLDRADAATIPIIAMTANAYAEDVEAAKEAGMNAHLAKPIEPDILYQTIAEALQTANQ